jgi:hypothetical protein
MPGLARRFFAGVGRSEIGRVGGFGKIPGCKMRPWSAAKQRRASTVNIVVIETGVIRTEVGHSGRGANDS